MVSLLRPLTWILFLAAMPPVYAGGAEAIGGSGIYTFVDDYGVSVFTDVPPPDYAPSPAGVPVPGSATSSVRPNAGGRRVAGAVPQVVAAVLDAATDTGQDTGQNPVLPEMRDGGLPPDDH